MQHKSLFRNILNMFLRLTGYHIMAIFVMMSILAFFPGIEGGIVAQFVGIGIVIVLPYLTVWKWGDSDCNKIANGRIKADSLLGVKIGFAAYSPYLLVGVLLVISKFGVISDSMLSWYRFICTPFLPLNQSLMPTTLMLSEQSYLSVFVSVLMLISVPISISLAYYMGINRISFSETYGFGKKDKTE